VSYIGNQPGYGKPEVFVFTATGGETSVSTADDGRSINYAVGYVSVYLNGVLLVDGTDYTATNGSSITGLTALTASDVVTVVSFETFAIPDAVSEQSGGAFLGDVTVPNLLVGDGGNVGSVSDPDALSIASGGVVTFSQGLSFGADTLDDYEEGTWTPAYGTTGTAISSVTYNSDRTFGRYTKIGDTVVAWGGIATNSVTVGSASGLLTLGNLPLTPLDTGGANRYYAGVIAGIEDFVTTYPTHLALVQNNVDFMYLTSQSTSSDVVFLTPSNLSAGSGDNWIFGFSIVYKVA